MVIDGEAWPSIAWIDRADGHALAIEGDEASNGQGLVNKIVAFDELRRPEDAVGVRDEVVARFGDATDLFLCGPSHPPPSGDKRSPDPGL